MPQDYVEQLLDAYDCTAAERELVIQASSTSSVAQSRSKIISQLVLAKSIKHAAERVIDSNEKLSRSNEKYSDQMVKLTDRMVKLTWALVFVGSVQAFVAAVPLIIQVVKIIRSWT